MTTNMNYEQARDWIVKEERFDEQLLGKTESIMCLGNGYMGIRASTEERYLKETRNCFVAGTFNQSDKTEVTELPNVADIVQMEIILDGEYFSLVEGEIVHYEKCINLKTGELFRNIEWVSPKGKRYILKFSRFVSLDNLHLIGQRVRVLPMDGNVHLQVCTGIDGTMTNSGAGHFEETQKRFYDNQYMQYVQTTTESRIVFLINAVVSAYLDNEKQESTAKIGMSRRKVFGNYDIMIPKNTQAKIEKISTIHTTRDCDYQAMPLEAYQEKTLQEIQKLGKCGYNHLFNASKLQWEEYFTQAIEIDCENPMDQLSIRFSQYHLRIMTPFHDNRMNVGAKGLSGEGYKGHTFWDTELFILPYYTFQFPEIARNLIQYRYHGLEGARKKAMQNNYEGAQYMWESAWIEDGEVTPEYGDVDIVTGKAQTIWTGKLEQHITADVIYGLWQYYQMSGDELFMEECGYEMIFETAQFWCSRLEDGEDGKLHINNVIGPDEYKEHVDDNAFTNYMAYWNLSKAIEVYDKLEKEVKEQWENFNQKLQIEKNYPVWKEKIQKIFLPKPRTDGVIAQDATYLTLQEIDLSKYKEQDFVLGIYKDYNAKQMNEIQVSKQADILIIFFLLENYFTQAVKVANWNYYEPKTLHDSSLSLSTHCILANDIGKSEVAYHLYEELCQTDLGAYMKSSDGGIHAASLGGIWEATIFGFCGVRLLEEELRIRPALPKGWHKISFRMKWRGVSLHIMIDTTTVEIEVEGRYHDIEKIEINGEKYHLNQHLSVRIH